MHPRPAVATRAAEVAAGLRLAALALLCACPAPPADTPPHSSDATDSDSDSPPDSSPTDSPTDSDSPDSDSPDTGTPDPTACAEVDAFVPVYADLVARWSAQDALGGWPPSPVVFVGSSTIRRFEGLAPAFQEWSPLQRGFGGAQLGEVALWADELVLRHDPRAVVVFAGTNDVDAGVATDVVLSRLRCLRQRVGEGLGWDRPVLFVSITPTPARWQQWPQAQAVNEGAAALAAADGALVYVDTATAFLATGSPPDPSLFVEDGLHLSDAGYTLWAGLVEAALAEAAAPTAPPEQAPAALAPGTRLLLDLGPSNAEDGEPTPSPDWLGQAWNNWHPLDGGDEVLPGEQLVDLLDTDGLPTGIDLVVGGGFYVNGRANGGLLWPDPERLGELAVGSATGDYVYVDGPDHPGALWLRGLDPAGRYTLRLFAARDDAERRLTRYVVTGADTVEATLQTSGAGAGADGATTNDDTVVELPALAPDAWGHLFLDVQIEEGSFAYLALLELTVEG